MTPVAILNGLLPESMLATISGTNQRVAREFVAQTEALRTAFQERFGKALKITDAYRTFDEQVSLKADLGSFAAKPGTSNHGWGRAIDFGSGVNVEESAEYLWMKANAPDFGWHHPKWAEDNNPKNGQQEPWHWEATLAAGLFDVSPEMEDDMYNEDDRFAMGLVLAAVGRMEIAMGQVVPNTNRLPHIHTQADIIAAGVGNVTNGVVTLLARDPGAVTAADIAEAIPDDFVELVAAALAARIQGRHPPG